MYCTKTFQISLQNFLEIILQCAAINEAACELAREVADEGDALVAGGISQTPTYLSGGSKEEVQAQYKQQLDQFVKCGVDFLICEVSSFNNLQFCV